MRGNAKAYNQAGRPGPSGVDCILRKHAAANGLERGYSAHPLRAMFIIMPLEDGVQLENVQKAGGRAS